MSIDFDLVKKKIDAMEERKRKTLQTKERNLIQRLREKWTEEGVTPEVLRPEVGYQAHCTGTDHLELLPEGVRLLNEVPVPNPEEVKKNLLRLKWEEVLKSRS